MLVDPLAPLSLTLEVARIGMEAQAVIAMRLAGMAGFWETPPSEFVRMVAEKPQAAVEAVEAATLAAIRGGSADEVMHAGLREIGRHTAGNFARLSQMGPSFGAEQAAQ
ncbi:hypothetical protein [Rhodobacter xanthinilyticus]|uniref:hypothetical protein n=1 Tax=Rhodobacter xanthinilyticus TaxID=1850250 RepID=UPI0012EC168F|nr:hypothetical protein [Rhodobacter xanthinilyticus]